MRRFPAVAAAALGAVACLLLTGGAAPAAPAAPPTTTTPFQTPDTSACPYRVTPPAPIDRSEAPAPGQPAPTPLPTRPDPVGGRRMTECDVVLPAAAPPLPVGLSAASWLVADLDTGEVLAARDPHARHRPASCIKILTGLLAIRSLDPHAEVIGTDEDAAQEGTRVGIGPDGHYTVDLLLHGLLMSSGNDAAHALAVQLGGVPETVRRMQALAASLGALDTRIATPSGLDGPGASTSAYDLGLIFRVAMRTSEFASIIGTAQLDFPGFRDKPGFKIGNDNKLLLNYPGALGGKTGFTDDARHTFIGSAARGDRRLLVVLMRGEQQPVRMWEQGAHLLDYGFALPAGTPAVGTLVDSAPTSSTIASVAGSASSGPGDLVAVAPAARTGRSATVYVAALLLLAVVLAATTLLLRRRRRPEPR